MTTTPANRFVMRGSIEASVLVVRNEAPALLKRAEEARQVFHKDGRPR